MTDIDRKALDQARKWAALRPPVHNPEAVAAAEVIQSLPDEIIDADEVRNIIKVLGDSLFLGQYSKDWVDGYDAATRDVIDLLEDLLPAPRTLADMDPGERQACQWMWVDVAPTNIEEGETMMLILPRPMNSVVLSKDGYTANVNNDRIVPRPDLPRMGWAGDGEQGATDD